ncbi:hypothetical protein ABC345_05910 [Shouchella sp. 1P09AA]|uniref:hypothetical protein n=1 Tax=unclassified Shouchella TaxID=2893065 RepID=UPI0039A35B8F
MHIALHIGYFIVLVLSCFLSFFVLFGAGFAGEFGITLSTVFNVLGFSVIWVVGYMTFLFTKDRSIQYVSLLCVVVAIPTWLFLAP